MPINAKVKAEIERQMNAGSMARDYGTQLIATLDNAPDDFQAAFLAGPDYQRQSQSLKSERDAWENEKTQWKDWRNTVQTQYDAATNDLTSARNKITELEAKIAAGNLPAGSADDFKKQIESLESNILTKLQGAGFVTKADHEKAIRDAELRAVGMMGDIHHNQRVIESKYQEDFGKPMNPLLHSELVNKANEMAKAAGRYVPLEEAYQAQFGGDIEKLKEERWMQKGAEKWKAEHPEIPGVSGGPGGFGSPAALGPLQQRLKEGKDFTSTDGDLLSAKQTAVELLRGGAGR